MSKCLKALRTVFVAARTVYVLHVKSNAIKSLGLKTSAGSMIDPVFKKAFGWLWPALSFPAGGDRRKIPWNFSPPASPPALGGGTSHLVPTQGRDGHK